MGTPDFAVPTLECLARAAGFELTAAVCQPDRPAGRHGAISQPAVKRAALALGLEVYQPERMRRPEAVAWLKAQRPDALAVVAYGQLLPPEVFDLPQWGAINAHASLLPAYRGAAPIQWAIARGETRAGVTTMRINAGLDTGDILLTDSLAIGPDETAPDLSRRLSASAAALMEKTLLGLAAGTVRPTPQPEEGTLAPLLTRGDGAVDWTRPAAEIYNRWRGFQPWPGIHTVLNGRQLAILKCHPELGTGEPGRVTHADGRLVVACGQDALGLDTVRAEGRQAVSGDEFARGARLAKSFLLR
jgi:methionyl-tRNA formyltransferase